MIENGSPAYRITLSKIDPGGKQSHVEIEHVDERRKNQHHETRNVMTVDFCPLVVCHCVKAVVFVRGVLKQFQSHDDSTRQDQGDNKDGNGGCDWQPPLDVHVRLRGWFTGFAF